MGNQTSTTGESSGSDDVDDADTGQTRTHLSHTSEKDSVATDSSGKLSFFARWFYQGLKDDSDCATSSKEREKHLISDDVASAVDDNNLIVESKDHQQANVSLTTAAKTEPQHGGSSSEGKSALLSDQSERSNAVNKKTKKNKNKNKMETDINVDPVSLSVNNGVRHVHDSNKADPTSITDGNQTAVSTSAVHQVHEIRKNGKEDLKARELKTEESIPKQTTDKKQRGASFQNETDLTDFGNRENSNVRADLHGKKKKKKKRKKKLESELKAQPQDENPYAVLATGLDDPNEVESKRPSPEDPTGQKNGKGQPSSVVKLGKEKNATAAIMSHNIQDKADLVTTSKSEPCSKALATSVNRDDPEADCNFADEDNRPETLSTLEERNILCIFKLVYGVGLRVLRKLFMEINPAWSNQPSDAAGFDKGKMKLGKDEEIVFNRGDINEWDFSLMTTALLYSKRGVLEINKRPGYVLALRELKNCRNKLLGHPSTEKMSNADFNVFWPVLSNNFITLGADPDDIAEIPHQSDESLFSGKYYKQLFLTERAKQSYCEEKLEVIDSKLDVIIANQSSDTAFIDPVYPGDLGRGPKWDEWLIFRDVVGDFESPQNQYILVTDALPTDDLEYFSLLRGVSWKMVLDFDPMSEEKGFYHKFTSKDGQANLVSMITPAELKKSTTSNLLRQIDPQKVQWLFVNGRYSDTEGSAQSFSDWEATSVKHITRLFVCCSDPDKFDKQKPVVCLILPFKQTTLPYLEVTLSRLNENFDEYRLKFVSFKHKLCHLISKTFEVRHFDLSPKQVSQGLSEILSSSTTHEHRMPSSQAGVPAKLSQNEFLYLKEHLQILFDGCEDLPEFSNDPGEKDNFFEQHRRSFISGNQISLVSLYDNHDARREIGTDIRSHVQRLLDQGLTRSLIVEIRHSPGTGGSTIARRVMWDLHKSYPCALLEISSSRHYFDEDNALSNIFADRITALEEICGTSPVILIDGQQSGIIEGLSNKLVRMLCNKGKRALLLRCQHGSKASKRATQESLNVHHVFGVNVKLEDSTADLNEFQSKYKEYIAQSLHGNQRPNLCRVFHFPLLSMMEEFRPKLRKIIADTLDEMGGVQQSIALVVAFLQKYANHATPALLLYEAFKDYILVSTEKTTTNEDINQLFTEHLLNLMVPTKPLRPRVRSSALKTAPEFYTLQHPLVADLVLRKVFRAQKCDLFGVVRRFLQFPIYQHECFLPLFEELFLYNKYGRKQKFSILFEELKGFNSELAAQIFCEAAVKTNDATIFANAARFLAKKEPPSFSEAKDVIQQAFQANNSKMRLRSLYHTKGVVLYIAMKHNINSGEVKDLQTLEDLASEVLKAFHEARNFPPTYPHPLIGEVELWLACIAWIMKNECSNDSDNTFKFLTNHSPGFFRTCVSDSFYLLDIVDSIVQSVPNLTDPEETQRLSNNARLSLMKTFKQGLSATGRRHGAEDLIQACKALCSAPNFPRASQVELKRLQAHFILSDSDHSIDGLNNKSLAYLLKLLEELVLVENDYRLAYHLMKVCVLVTGPRCYSLEQGLTVSERWRDVFPNDYLPYFYQMTIYFLKILDGNSLEFTAQYIKAQKMCREKSQNHFRSTQSTLFVGKEGQGMSRLITRNTLFRGETEYATDDSEKVSKFWRIDSRRKLLECKGRIRVEQSSGRGGKIHPCIELVQGNLQLYVGKNADIGKVERDFTPGALVYFVVSFNLHGPVANGITFSSQNPAPGNG